MQLPGKSKPQNAGAFAEPGAAAAIRAAIRARGPLSFAAFMEAALYHPEHGYYNSGRARLGREGDYFTSVSVGPLFGRLLAVQFAQVWELLERPTDFTLVEQGAHDGAFARDVLAAAREHHADFFRACRYLILEPCALLQERQAATLAAFADKVGWRNTIKDLEPFRGVHFSNELLDSMPVHLLRWNGREWLERNVDLHDDVLEFLDLPLTNPRLAEHLRKIPRPQSAVYETEVNLAALDWIAALAPRLTQGLILAADYGFAREEFYAAHRTRGTLQCYAQHKLVPSPLEQIGAADITAHVEWTSLAESAQAAGLTLAGFTDQHHFITGLLTEELVRQPQLARALQTLLHPGFLGMKFQFLALAKNFPAAARLRGLRFARDPQSALGLPVASATLAP